MPEIELITDIPLDPNTTLQRPRRRNKQYKVAYASTCTEAPNEDFVEYEISWKDGVFVSEPPGLLLPPSIGEPEEIDACFDQRNRLWVAWRTSTESYLYWYDSNLPGFTTTPLGKLDRIQLVMTDRNYYSSLEQQNFVILFLQRDSLLFYRTQSERFNEEWQIGEVGNEEEVASVGMNTTYRFQVAISGNALGALNVQMPDTYAIIVNDKFVGVSGAYVAEDIKNE